MASSLISNPYNFKKQFFIGGSKKYMLFTDALKELFKGHKTIEAVTWSDFFKKSGGNKYTYESLLKAIKEFEFAVFFITGDWEIKQVPPLFAATPNVWFEAGMFMSRYGKENVLFFEEQNDVYKNKIQFLSDLTGLQPEYYELPLVTRAFIRSKKRIPAWSSLPAVHKKNILKEFSSLKEKIEENINDDKERIFDTIINIDSRDECYKQGRKIIMEANEYLFSIVSYENEYDDDSKFPNGLMPCIEEKYKILHRKKGFTEEKSRQFFKRWMNVANNKIAEQAKLIISKYGSSIEIRDTYCNFIEVLITENRVLIVLPKPKNNKTQIGRGVLIKSEKIAKEFATWFENMVPEPNEICLNSEKKLDDYRNFTWDLQNKRMEGFYKNGLNHRCNACFVKWIDQPDEIKKKIKAKSLRT